MLQVGQIFKGIGIVDRHNNTEFQKNTVKNVGKNKSTNEDKNKGFIFLMFFLFQISVVTFLE